MVVSPTPQFSRARNSRRRINITSGGTRTIPSRRGAGGTSGHCLVNSLVGSAKVSLIIASTLGETRAKFAREAASRLESSRERSSSGGRITAFRLNNRGVAANRAIAASKVSAPFVLSGPVARACLGGSPGWSAWTAFVCCLYHTTLQMGHSSCHHTFHW